MPDSDLPPEAHASQIRAQLYERLRTEISARLRTICAHWSDADFETLIESAVAIELKYMEQGPRGKV